MGTVRILGSSMAFLLWTLAVSGPLAAKDDVLWHKFVAAVSTLTDVECRWQMENRAGGDGAPSTGDGFYLRMKYKLLRWNLPRDFHYMERSSYQPYHPPYEWMDSVDFKSDRNGGFFNRVHHSGTVTQKKSEKMPFPVPNPIGFFSGGMNMPVAELINSSRWNISNHEGKLVLEGKSDSDRIVLELDPDHGWLPKRAEHHFKDSYVALIVDQYHQNNGVWFPVEMRSIRLDRKGDEFVHFPINDYRLVVDPASLKCNPNLGIDVYRFEFPADAFISDRDTGRIHEGELGLQKMVEFRRNAQEKTINQGTSYPWLFIASIVSAVVCATFVILVFWRRSSTPTAILIGISLPVVLSGCGHFGNEEGGKNIKAVSIVEILDSTQTITAPTGTAVEGTVSFVVTNVATHNIDLESPVAGCSCSKEMTFDKVTLAPKETAELKVRVVQKVGMDAQRYQVGFGARTPTGIEPFRVFVQILPDRD
jgi:hypothetical protein